MLGEEQKSASIKVKVAQRTNHVKDMAFIQIRAKYLLLIHRGAGRPLRLMRQSSVEAGTVCVKVQTQYQALIVQYAQLAPGNMVEICPRSWTG